MSSIEGPHALQVQTIPVFDLATSVRAGFPSPAEDLGAKGIDLAARLIKHPQATFLMRARGDSMKDAGIFDGDVLLVDRAIPPRNGQVGVAVIGEPPGHCAQQPSKAAQPQVASVGGVGGSEQSEVSIAVEMP
jgi:SOS-response transcriptional repressor LexA